MLRTGQFCCREPRKVSTAHQRARHPVAEFLRFQLTPWSTFFGGCRPALHRALLTAAFATCLIATIGRDALGQLAPVAPVAVMPQALPEPIYWKQHLFLIPYQWGSAAQSGAARSVTLFVSKDRGASWQKISEARPEVKSFNYRAEGDGEYWFAVRTLDIRGRSWPEGPYLPELRVIVDTTIPRIDALRVQPAANGAIDIECRATDVNLDPGSLRVEAQIAVGGPWQLVPLQAIGGGQFGAIQVRWTPAMGVRPIAIRARISDRAGNSADYQTTIGAGPAISGPLLSQPALSVFASNPFDAMPKATAGPISSPPIVATSPTSQGWMAGPAVAAQPAGPPAAQQWPAGAMARAPFRLWTSETSQQDDGLTAYGSPQVSAIPVVPPLPSRENQADGALIAGSTLPPRVPAHYAGAAKTEEAATSDGSGWTSGTNGPQFAPLEPFRQATTSGATDGGVPMSPVGLSLATLNNQPVTPIDSPPPTHRPATQPKLVGSRTFALEYDLDGAGSAGVSKVELWGTRDGGQSWSRFAQDDDNRSPLIVTVDNEGTYGFKILVQNAGGAAIDPPRVGEEPELWVSVDLKRPIVELTAIERGEGNLADHLILRWRAQDNNLEQRPISLYFSSRPGGPWSAIATNLEDTGQYAWRVERYVPTRIYLRIEARDTAGNLAAFQTREPVEFSSPQLTGRLRSAAPAGPTANGSNDSYR